VPALFLFFVNDIVCCMADNANSLLIKFACVLLVTTQCSGLRVLRVLDGTAKSHTFSHWLLA